MPSIWIIDQRILQIYSNYNFFYFAALVFGFQGTKITQQAKETYNWTLFSSESLMIYFAYCKIYNPHFPLQHFCFFSLCSLVPPIHFPTLLYI